MKRIFFVLFFAFLANGLSAQQLTSVDYQIGPIQVSSSLDSVIKAFGPPNERTDHPLLKVVKPESAIVLKYD